MPMVESPVVKCPCGQTSSNRFLQVMKQTINLNIHLYIVYKLDRLYFEIKNNIVLGMMPDKH